MRLRFREKSRLREKGRLRSRFRKFSALSSASTFFIALTFAFFCIVLSNGCGRKGNLELPEDKKEREGKEGLSVVVMVG